MPDKIDWRHKPEKARLAAYDIRRTALSNAWKKRFAHDDFSPEERRLGGLPHKLPKGDAPAPSPQDEELGIRAAWDGITGFHKKYIVRTERHSVSGWPGALRAPSIISAAKRRSLAQATEPFRRHLPLMLRGYRPGKRPLMRRNAGARRERRTRCVDRRGCACRPPQRSSPCGRRPQRPSSTGQQPAKQRRQSCTIGRQRGVA